MQARLTAYPPDSAASIRSIGPGDALRIGRAGDSGLRLEHPSISRRHAELHAAGDGWQLRDMGSKNGSFVDGTRITQALLDHACWLRFGDVFCEFAPLTAADIAAGESGMHARRAAATAHTARLDGVQRLDDLLDASLHGVLDLAQCERGFILLEHDGDFLVRASLAMDPARLATREFSGSVGAVRRVLQSRRSLVVNDVGREGWLASRASVAAGGLDALACLPLLDGDEAMGVIYADRVHVGPPISTLDLELLEAFSERASLWLAARRTRDWLDGETPGAHWSEIVAMHADGAVAQAAAQPAGVSALPTGDPT
jgi:GAF domain-containing protein